MTHCMRPLNNPAHRMSMFRAQTSESTANVQCPLPPGRDTVYGGAPNVFASKPVQNAPFIKLGECGASCNSTCIVKGVHMCVYMHVCKRGSVSESYNVNFFSCILNEHNSFTVNFLITFTHKHTRASHRQVHTNKNERCSVDVRVHRTRVARSGSGAPRGLSEELI